MTLLLKLKAEDFWGTPDAHFTWCETYYDKSPYLAEYWNALSNVPFFLLFAYLSYKLCRTGDYGVSQYCLVGVGSTMASFMAHATARRMAEVADELFVVYPISALALNLYPALLANLQNSRLPGYLNFRTAMFVVNTSVTITALLGSVHFDGLSIVVSIVIALFAYGSATWLIYNSRNSRTSMKLAPVLISALLFSAMAIMVQCFLLGFLRWLTDLIDGRQADSL